MDIITIAPESLFFTEEKQRYQVFVKNMHKADKLQRMELGTATYGATEFADMTGEFLQLQSGVAIIMIAIYAMKTDMVG